MGIYSDAVLVDGPVAFWRLDEKAGTVAQDIAGNYDGTYVGDPQQIDAVVSGETGAMQSISINQFVETSLNSSPSVFTAEIVIVVLDEQITDSPTLLGHRRFYASPQSSFPFSLTLTSQGKITANYSTGNDFSHDLQLISEASIEFGKTYHIAAKRDANGNCSLRVNKAVVTGFLGQNLSTYSANWTIGRSHEYSGGINQSSYIGISCMAAIYDYAVPDERLDLHADLAVTTLSLQFEINESLAATTFLVGAFRIPDMQRSFVGEFEAGIHELFIPFQYNGPQLLTVMPKIGEPWQPDTAVILDQLVFPNDPEAKPYYHKCITPGTTASTEPDWPTTAGAQTVDGSAEWELVERMVQPIAHGPLIPI